MSKVPVAVVMISLNEGHNLNAVLDNIQDWAEEVFLLDSFSSDDTIDIALKRGVYVAQHKFEGFGEQWNVALQGLPIKSPWTMKLDPDERLTDALKESIQSTITQDAADGIKIQRRLWFMGRLLPVKQEILRLWKTGRCKFTQVLVNEHPVVTGKIASIAGELEHHDSPDLHHWYEKQNRYTTAEALSTYRGNKLAAAPKLFGSAFERRMYLKKNFSKIPFRFIMLFCYNYLYKGCWRVGKVGYIWSKLRVEVYKAREYKLIEMKLTEREQNLENHNPGIPDERVPQI